MMSLNYLFTSVFAFFLLFSSFDTVAQTTNSKPKVNQVGYYPESSKLGITPETGATTFYLKDVSTGAIVFEGNLSSSKFYGPGSENVKVADFTGFQAFGTFKLGIHGGEESYSFKIGNNVFSELNEGILKAFYFNRASTALPEEYAGVWNRPLGHPDSNVLVHNSAASTNRPANSSISSPKGWYDAGDYNKYVVPISSSISQLLFAYEEFPEYFQSLEINIPESGDNIPDILDESLWALRWLFTMQDPDDGGVYHKLTTSNFQATVMPHVPTATRYVVQKGTGATYDFAAVMAQASRVYEEFLPDFADSALDAAKKAFDWAEANPNISYNQGALSDPAINTGGYGDSNFSDEKFWASSELYITTGDDTYYMDNGWSSAGVVGWNSVRGLGLFSMVTNRTELTANGLADTTSMKQRVMSIADSYVNGGLNSAYRSAFGYSNGHFFWGSNGFAGNIALATMLAYRVSGDQKYYTATLDVIDFIMGRNPLDQSYVTGFGSNPPMHIHHRQSEADNVVAPVPGWVAGGANPGNQSQDCGAGAYNSMLPALSFLDDYCSYSTNEITTYWNSPFIYALTGLENLTPEADSTSTSTGFFKSFENKPYFDPGELIDIQWTVLDEGFTNINLYYRTLKNSNTVLLGENIPVSDTLFQDFEIPNLPGEQIVFRIESAVNADLWFQSSIITVSPPKSITINSFEARFLFRPGRKAIVTWNTVAVDTLDILTRLSSENEFTLVQERVPASDGSYGDIVIPEAPGDSLIVRVQAHGIDSVYSDSEPKQIPVSTSTEDPTLVHEFRLNQNYPNPFNPTTTITFSLPKASFTQLGIFNAMGQQVVTLVNGLKPSGLNSVTWDASSFASGVYYLQIKVDNHVLTRKMTLIK